MPQNTRNPNFARTSLSRISSDGVIRGVSLCSGTGGLDLGIQIAIPDYRAVCMVEREAFAVACLVAQMENGSLAPALIWDDLFTLDGRAFRGRVDLISAGLPCQPYSVAGKRRGHDDERALWPEFIRIVDEAQPALVFLENVAAYVGYFRPVGERLSDLGYQIEAGIFSAAEVGAPHRRERFFMLAYRATGGRGELRESSRSPGLFNGDRKTLADRDGGISERQRGGVSGIIDAPRRDHAEHGSQGVADAGNGFLSFEGRGSERRDGTRPAGADLGESECSRWPSARLRGSDVDGGCESETASRAMGNADLSGAARQREHSGPVSSRCDFQTLGESDRDLGNPNQPGSQRRQRSNGECTDQLPTWPPSPADYDRWRRIPEELKPAICRVADGASARVDRLRACGNGVVPLQAAYAFTLLARRLRLG